MASGAEVTTPRLLVRLPTWLLSQANVRAHRILSETLAAHEVRGHHIRILASLDEFGSMSQVDLGRAAELDRADVARAVGELEQSHLIGRRVDTTDARRKLVSITSRGRRRQRELERVLASIQRDVLAPLDSSEQDTLLRLLARLQP